jgi:hypothetical protein
MATLLCVSRSAISKVMTAYTNHGKTSSAKRNSGWKTKLSEREHCIVSNNHGTAAAKVTAKLNIHLEDFVSTKTIWQELHKSKIHSTAAIAKPLIIENNAKRQKQWYYDHKTWMFDDWKYVIWSDKSFFTFPTSGLCLENARGSL